MYEKALIAHNALRWFALASVAFAFLRALRGWLGNQPFTSTDRTATLLAVIAVDLQITLGLLLYFVWSPQVKSALQDMGAAMKNPELRFWAVEHVTIMVLAIACVHLGKVLARRATTDAARHKRAALLFGLGLVLMLVGTPWPSSKIPRPLFRA